jgi:RNA polymerase sigma-70 factor (ECF subfamily)
MDTKQLVKDCLNNNRQAQQTLYKQYASSMMGLCYRYTKSFEDAQDVLQEGFVKVFNHLEKYNYKGELGAWIRRIMVNTALTYLAKHHKYKNDVELEQSIMHIAVVNEPEIKLNEKQIVEQIRQLPIQYQTIFNLVAIEGFSQIEVANMLETNINTIRSQYSREQCL